MTHTIENFRDIGLRYWGDFEDINCGWLFSAMDAEVHLAIDEFGCRKPYELETRITEGVLGDLFDIREGSNFRVDVVIFKDEGERQEYLRLRDEWEKERTIK